MIKISKDNLFLWSRVFVIGILLVHLFLIIAVFSINFWVMYVAYAFIASGHFVFARIWRYLFIQESYLSNEGRKILFEDLKGKKREFDLNQIVKCSTYNGITDVILLDNGKKLKLYFMAKSKESLQYIQVPKQRK